METDSRSEGVETLREPHIKLVRGGGEQGRRDMQALDGALQALPIGFVPHGSGGAPLSVGAARWMRMGTWSDPVEGRVVASQDQKAGRMSG